MVSAQIFVRNIKYDHTLYCVCLWMRCSVGDSECVCLYEEISGALRDKAVSQWSSITCQRWSQYPGEHRTDRHTVIIQLRHLLQRHSCTSRTHTRAHTLAIQITVGLTLKMCLLQSSSPPFLCLYLPLAFYEYINIRTILACVSCVILPSSLWRCQSLPGLFFCLCSFCLLYSCLKMSSGHWNVRVAYLLFF